MIMMFGIKSHRHEVAHVRAIDEGTKIFLRDAGSDPETYTGSVADTLRDIQIAKRERAKRLGIKEWDQLTDGQLSDGRITGMFPNVQMGMNAEGVFIMRFVPHATDPKRFYYDNMLLYRHVDEPNYDVPAWMVMSRELDITGETRPDIERWSADVTPEIGSVLLQDSSCCRTSSRVSNRVVSRAAMGEQEQRVRYFHREVDRYFNDKK